MNGFDRPRDVKDSQKINCGKESSINIGHHDTNGAPAVW